MVKTHKLIAKRLRLTKKEKILHRACGQNHFNARESGETTKNKRQNRSLGRVFKKTLKQHLH